MAKYIVYSKLIEKKTNKPTGRKFAMVRGEFKNEAAARRKANIINRRLNALDKKDAYKTKIHSVRKVTKKIKKRRRKT